jgi:hypothetical protein
MSKTQAQKNAERHARHQKKEQERITAKALRDSLTKEELQNNNNINKPSGNNAGVTILSKKELRKLNKENNNSNTPHLAEKIKKQQDKVSTSEENFIHAYKPFQEPDREEYKRSNHDCQQLVAEDIAKEKAHTGEYARIVENHSTYCNGLKPVLYKLSKKLPKDCTILPGEISQVGSHYEQFELRFQRNIDYNTFKFVARKGSTTQDVTISVSTPETITEQVLINHIEDVIENIFSPEDGRNNNNTNIPLSDYNREKDKALKNSWKEQHQDQHQETKQKQKQAKQQQLVDEQARTLKTKGLKASEVESYALRDVNIKSGKNRTKSSMK